jgi:hypothetical protein
MNLDHNINFTQRELDIVIPTYNRTFLLYRLIQSAIKIKLLVNNVYIVIIDNGTTLKEDIPSFGYVDTYEMFLKLAHKNVLYKRLKENQGVGGAWEWYFKSNSIAKYFLPIPDKYIFLNTEFIKPSLDILNRDEKISLVINPVLVNDRSCNEYEVNPGIYGTFTDKHFFKEFVARESLQHLALGGASILRSSIVINKRLPRRLYLNYYGLDDGFGIDADLLFNIVEGSKVFIGSHLSVKVNTQNGGTERYPLTFAYCYYQYLKRVCKEMVVNQAMQKVDMKKHLGFFILLMLRGYTVSLNPVHGTESEVGTSRIKAHMRKSFIFYIINEVVSQGLILSPEAKKTIIKLIYIGFHSRYRFYLQSLYLSTVNKG